MDLPDPSESMAQLGGVQSQQRQGEVLNQVEIGDALQPRILDPENPFNPNPDDPDTRPTFPDPYRPLPAPRLPGEGADGETGIGRPVAPPGVEPVVPPDEPPRRTVPPRRPVIPDPGVEPPSETPPEGDVPEDIAPLPDPEQMPEPETEPRPSPEPSPIDPSEPIEPSGDHPTVPDERIDDDLRGDMDEMDMSDFIDIKKKTIQEGKVEYEISETYKNKRLIVFDVGQQATRDEIQSFWIQTLTQAGLMINNGDTLFSNAMNWIGLGNNIKNHGKILSRSASLLISHSQGYNWLGPELSFGRPKNILDCIAAVHDAEYMLSGTHTHDADMDFINRCDALKNGFIMAKYTDEDTGEVVDYTPQTNMSMLDYAMIDNAKSMIEQKDHIQYSDSSVYQWLGLSKKNQEDSGLSERDFLLQQLNKARQELHDVKEQSNEEQFEYFKLKQKQSQSDKMVNAYQKIILSILRNEPPAIKRQRIQMVINYLNQHSKAFSHSHMRDDRPQIISY